MLKLSSFALERVIKRTRLKGNQKNEIQVQRPDMENRQTQQRT